MTWLPSEQVQVYILNALADTQDPNARDQVYGRHDAQARFSWDDENALLTAIADSARRAYAAGIPYLDYSRLPPDQVRQQCTMLKMLTTQPGAQTPAMPRLRAGTNRRYATADEINLIVAWLQGQPYPRPDPDA